MNDAGSIPEHRRVIDDRISRKPLDAPEHVAEGKVAQILHVQGGHAPLGCISGVTPPEAITIRHAPDDDDTPNVGPQ